MLFFYLWRSIDKKNKQMKKTILMLTATSLMFACSNSEEQTQEIPAATEVVEEVIEPSEEELINNEIQSTTDELTSIESELDSLINN